MVLGLTTLMPDPSSVVFRAVNENKSKTDVVDDKQNVAMIKFEGLSLWLGWSHPRRGGRSFGR